MPIESLWRRGVWRPARLLVALDALDQRERPELEQGGAPGERLADLLAQQDRGGAEEEKEAVSVAARFQGHFAVAVKGA